MAEPTLAALDVGDPRLAPALRDADAETGQQGIPIDGLALGGWLQAADGGLGEAEGDLRVARHQSDPARAVLALFRCFGIM